MDPYDSYGSIPWADEKAHLDNFALFLEQQKDTVGYIIAYGGRRSCANEARDRARRARAYVVSRGIPASRLKWIDGGYREEATVVLQPASRSVPKPTASPTLKRNQVQIVRNCKSKTNLR